MRFKLFLASLLACGFIAFVIANENYSAEVETPKQKTLPSKQQQQPAAQSTVLQPKSEAIEMIAMPPTNTKKSTKKLEGKPLPAAGNSVVLAASNTTSLQRSGALKMFDDYLGELGWDTYGDSGYNWGESLLLFC